MLNVIITGRKMKYLNSKTKYISITLFVLAISFTLFQNCGKGMSVPNTGNTSSGNGGGGGGGPGVTLPLTLKAPAKIVFSGCAGPIEIGVLDQGGQPTRFNSDGSIALSTSGTVKTHSESSETVPKPQVLFQFRSQVLRLE